MDRLHAMQLFTRVVDLGSFAAAAQQLNLAPSAVTRQIAALEAHLGVKLMTRSTRRLNLTSAGAAYLEKCRQILNLVDAAESSIAEAHMAPRGHIRISVPLSFGIKKLAPLLIEFGQRYTEVSLEMDYSDRRVHLIEEGIDLSVRITRRLAATDVVRKIGSSTLHLVATPAYLQRHGTPQHPQELTQHACLVYATGGQQEVWQFHTDGHLTKVPVEARLTANNGEVLAEAAAQGLGIAYLPDFIAAPFMAAGRLQPLLLDHPIPPLGIYVMLPGNRQVPHRVRVLVDFLAERLDVSPAKQLAV